LVQAPLTLEDLGTSASIDGGAKKVDEARMNMARRAFAELQPGDVVNLAARTLLTALDQLSLLLLGGLPWTEELSPTPFGDHQQTIRLRSHDAHTGEVGCSPWPFTARSLTVHCPAYDVPSTATRDPAVLGRMLQQPATRAIVSTLHPANP
jgi:hypothetical protein